MVMVLFIILIFLIFVLLLFQGLNFVFFEPLIMITFILTCCIFVASLVILFASKKRKQIITSLLCFMLSAFFVVTNSVLIFNTNETNPTYVIHAGGAQDDVTYLNCQEGFLNHINQGYTLIELDFLLTKDEQVICSHLLEHTDYSFENRPTLSEFENLTMLDKFHPITLDWLIETLEMYPDVKIVFDTKENDPSKVISAIISKCNQMQFDVYNRFIIQVYSVSNYESLQNFGFAEFWFTNYKSQYPASFVNKYFSDKQNVTTIVLNYPTWVLFKSFGYDTSKNIAVHTLNNQEDIDFVSNRGVDYIYID